MCALLARHVSLVVTSLRGPEDTSSCRAAKHSRDFVGRFGAMCVWCVWRGNFATKRATASRALGLRCVALEHRGNAANCCNAWRCVRLRTEVWRWDIVAMRRHSEAFVQTIVNLMVQVNKTHPAQLQYNGFLVLCASTACVQNGAKKQ